ncbi:hypothetical protein CNY89_12255 [Amaricoccus sp. HAR-UPW-R2A-40]|nr:hypothetical protein CNY89_12255 [Amaricoccus sp. HAR-UPW-R2A-40]
MGPWRDADAFAHAKFIAFAATARPLLAKAGVEPDAGCFEIPGDSPRRSSSSAAARCATGRARSRSIWSPDSRANAGPGGPRFA